MKKNKLTIEEQIAYMRDVKGIKFSIMNEEEAESFLVNHSYYFKLKAYAKNYEQYTSGSKIGQYIDLEFAYLKEISTIDMHLRKYIIRVALDIEHFLRTKLLRDFTSNESEDGYEIVYDFINNYPEVYCSIIKNKNNAYSGDLIEKYSGCFALWNLIELLSFGDFTKLYNLYYKKYKQQSGMAGGIFSVRVLRNAAAHNNCLINRLRKPYSKNITINQEINYRVSKIKDVKIDQRKKKMANPFIHDFVVMLFVFDKIVSSDDIKKYAFSDLKNMFDNRFIRNKDYFEKNLDLSSSYMFLKKVVDHFYNNSI